LKTFIVHIFAIFFSSLILFISKPEIDDYLKKKHPVPFLINSNTNIAHFDYLKPDVNLAISNSIKSGIPTVFGSSELSSNHLKGVCYNFFKEKHINLQTIGHAGFQCFAISTVLAANADLLKGSKIVINLSPVWFEGKFAKGTNLECFFEYNNNFSLNEILNNTNIPIEYKNYYCNYISDKYSQINSPNAMINILALSNKNQILYYPFTFMHKLVYEFNYKNDSQLQTFSYFQKSKNQTSIRYSFNKPMINWDSLYQSAISDFKKQSTNNSLGVYNEYYTTWIKDKRPKLIEPLPYNQEFEDFKMLLLLCKQTNCRPIFTISPINTLCYSNPMDINPIMIDIMKELDKNGFKYLDLFSSNLKNYEKGVLEDIMHPGDYGWYQLDKFIIDEFGNN
jgi:D-alanyl-lipoteichoic acid biosynthesis protein DltD